MPAKMKETEKKVIQWAKDKGIIFDGNQFTQHNKLLEEVRELTEAVFIKKDLKEILLEAGDVIVVLTNLLAIFDLSITDAYEAAYDKIKDRTGITENGTFIKN